VFPLFGFIEEPRGKPRGIFDRKEFYLFLIRSLTPQQAAENALAVAVQKCIVAPHVVNSSQGVWPIKRSLTANTVIGASRYLITRESWPTHKPMNNLYERDNVLFPHTWVLKAGLPQLEAHVLSLKKYPPIPTGAADPYTTILMGIHCVHVEKPGCHI
jgi:hypothetical protein